MEIAAFKVKSCNLPMLTFGHSDLNIWSYKSPIDTDLIVLDSWLKELSTLQISAKKFIIWGRYDFSKMTNEFCQQTGFVKKGLQITFRRILTDIQVLFQQFSSSKSNLEDFMQGYFSFFRKIVIEILKCKLST
jgi:hypothetical protein